jgi:uncharacterized damage-inducible protein DinB
MGPLDHYNYLTSARRRLLDRVRELTPEQYTQEFPFGLKSVRRTLLHMASAEWFILGQVRGELDISENPFGRERVPDFAALEKAWRELGGRTIDILQRERDWDRPIDFNTVIPTRQRFRVKASPIIIFTQFAYHEVHHRAQVMAMLRQLGVPVETLDFILLACEAVEER